ncbi:MAG: hypothetical protein OXG54_03220 [Gammaproteobacteria bacterium]|nr:hypothetical protein [Gammaproteobacteria bacterium]
MAVLRVSSGKVYTTYNEINEILAPAGMTVGEFSYPKDLKAKVEQMDMSLPGKALDLMFGEVVESVEGVIKDEDFDYSCVRAGAGVPVNGGTMFYMAYKGQVAMSMEMRDEDSDGYMVPHILRNNNLHFALVNAFVKGVQLEDGEQCVIYTTAGEWMNLTPECLNWVIFAVGAPAVGISFFDAEPDAQGEFDTEVRTDHAVLETMKF